MKQIESILIANRGEIACRIMRTAKRLGIRTVALCSKADLNALHAKIADQTFVLEGSTSLETYLSIGQILKAISATGVDAVHPGYGFLSENAEFAKAVTDSGTIFIGPTHSAIREMGSKLNSKVLAKKSGVPTLESTDVTNFSKEELIASVSSEDLPVLIKASLGGGGKGMRVVYDLNELVESVETAKREAKSAFSDETVFIEKYIENPRHIEIQILADSHSNVYALFERECSIQRRHQKIIEEAPCAILSPELRKQMSDAAVAVAKAVNYTNAGTVEFILDQKGNFYFLEMNTRLQVEHPVTEMVTQLDLVELQIKIAQGEQIEGLIFEKPIGHAIELRLYAEDPARDFIPSPGKIQSLHFDEDLVRLDTGYVSGSEVPSIYDPMIAKIIAHGEDRSQAILKLKKALMNSCVSGLITNKNLLIGILKEEEFNQAKTDTFYLQRHDINDLIFRVENSVLNRMAAVATITYAIQQKKGLVNQEGIAIGFRNLRSQPEKLVLRSSHNSEVELEVEYSFDRHNKIDHIKVNQDILEASLSYIGDDIIGLVTNGLQTYFKVEIFDNNKIWVGSPDGDVEFKVMPTFIDPAESVPKGSLVAPMPGTVTKILVEENDTVKIGQDLVIIEAMKMENKVISPIYGIVSSVTVKIGDQVSNNQILAIIQEDSQL